MSEAADPRAAEALSALLDHIVFGALHEKDLAAAAGLLTKKLMLAAGQTLGDMTALREAVGETIFEAQLKSLTGHQARLLALIEPEKAARIVPSCGPGGQQDPGDHRVDMGHDQRPDHDLREGGVRWI